MQGPLGGLIPRITKLPTNGSSGNNTTSSEEYQHYVQQLLEQLQLLPAKHLLVDKGQDDVQAYDIDARLKTYVIPFAVKFETSNERYNLQETFNRFLLPTEVDATNKQRCSTFVVLGRAGSGKTLFTLWAFLEYVLTPWHEYRHGKGPKPKPHWLPIYIPLKDYPYAEAKLQTYVENALLQDYRVDEADLIHLKAGLGEQHQQHILFILDGYDELGKGNNPNFSKVLLQADFTTIMLSPTLPSQQQQLGSSAAGGTVFVYLEEGKLCYIVCGSGGALPKSPVVIPPAELASISYDALLKKLRELQELRELQAPQLLPHEHVVAMVQYLSKEGLQMAWRYAKVLVTGRPEHFNNDSEHLTAFGLVDGITGAQLRPSYEVHYVAPFSTEDIEVYIQRYKDVVAERIASGKSTEVDELTAL